MSRFKGVKNGESKNTKYIRIAYERGLLQQRGTRSELARMLGITRQYVTHVIKDIESGAKGTV